MKRVVVLFTLFLLFAFINTVHSEVLRIGLSSNYPPVVFKDKGKTVGIEAELADNIGKITGMEIKLIEIPWDDLENALKQGTVDVLMSGISVTEERKKRINFTESYMTIGQMALIKADNIMTHSSKMSMYSSGKRFGVEKNTTGQQYAKSEFTSSQIVTFPGVEDGIKALKSNKIDYFIHDAPTIWQYTVLPQTQDKDLFGLYEYMTRETLAWAVKKGNTALLKKLNDALAEMQRRGLVNKVINQWIPLTIEVGH